MLDQRCDVGEDRLGQVRGQPALVLSMVGVGGAETVQQHDGSIDQRRRTERNRVDGRSGPPRSPPAKHRRPARPRRGRRRRTARASRRRPPPANGPRPPSPASPRGTPGARSARRAVPQGAEAAGQAAWPPSAVRGQRRSADGGGVTWSMGSPLAWASTVESSGSCPWPAKLSAGLRAATSMDRWRNDSTTWVPTQVLPTSVAVPTQATSRFGRTAPSMLGSLIPGPAGRARPAAHRRPRRCERRRT
jgi:hypothetical protein